VQAEALVAMLTLYRLTGDDKYWTAFQETLDFIEEHHVAAQGGWWANLNADGSLDDAPIRTSMWQGAYHAGRALLLAEELLRKIAQDRAMNDSARP
jgi:mannose/cellobiose epimerase-like protein (N-acyl-D-glucosamine 2-epimerase family)